MAENKKFSSRVQIVYRRSQPMTKVVVITAIVLSIGAMITLRWVQNDLVSDTAELKAQASHLERENRDLERKIRQLGSVQSVQEIAEEELGMVSQDAVIIKPE